jgi:hypothetical protein
MSASAVTSCDNRKTGKWCCHMVWCQVDRAATIENVIPHYAHQQSSHVFCWIHPEVISGELKQVSPSDSRVQRESAARQTSPGLRLLWDSCPWWRRGRQKISHCCNRLRSNTELLVRQSLASKDVNMEAMPLEAVTRHQTECVLKWTVEEYVN